MDSTPAGADTSAMYSNAMRESVRAVHGYPEKTNVRVDYVYEHGCNIIDEYIPRIRQECHARGVRFVAREYAPRKYSEDREFIERLPAMHAHSGVAYKRTFYPDTRPIQIIEEVVAESKIKLTAQEVWSRRIDSVVSALRALQRKREREERPRRLPFH